MRFEKEVCTERGGSKNCKKTDCAHSNTPEEHKVLFCSAGAGLHPFTIYTTTKKPFKIGIAFLTVGQLAEEISRVSGQ